MRIQTSIGEIIEAFYEEYLETYGDHELALEAARTMAEAVLAREAARPAPAAAAPPSARLRRHRPTTLSPVG